MRLRRGAAAAAWCCGCGVEGVEHGGARGWRDGGAGAGEKRRRVGSRAHGCGLEWRRVAASKERRRRLGLQASGGEWWRRGGGLR